MTTVFIIILGEDWPLVMVNYTRSVSSLYILYFLVVYCFGNFILLSLFTAILLEKFEPEIEEDDDDQKDKVNINKLIGKELVK